MMKYNTKSALQHPIFYHYTVSNCSEGQKHTLPQPKGKLPWFTSSQHTEQGILNITHMLVRL